MCVFSLTSDKFIFDLGNYLTGQPSARVMQPFKNSKLSQIFYAKWRNLMQVIFTAGSTKKDQRNCCELKIELTLLQFSIFKLHVFKLSIETKNTDCCQPARGGMYVKVLFKHSLSLSLSHMPTLSAFCMDVGTHSKCV